MAENLGPPAEYDDEPATRFRYPWAQWESEPFTQWTIAPEIDFPVRESQATAITNMVIQLHNRARKMKRHVQTRTDDPLELGRVLFCFRESGKPSPRLSWSTALSSAPVPTDDEIPHITCAICGALQARAPHLTDILECLVRNPNSGADTAMYARHRADENEAGLRKVDHTMSWTLEDGPK